MVENNIFNNVLEIATAIRFFFIGKISLINLVCTQITLHRVAWSCPLFVLYF